MATQWYQAVHATKRFRLGTEKKDYAGNVYVYLPGVASLAANDWVSFNPVGTYTTVRMVDADPSYGPLAIAQAANTSATNYSWFGIKGNFTGNKVEATTAGDPLYVSATAGSIDDDAVAGDWVSGANLVVELTATTGTFHICYPNNNSGYTT